VEIDGWLTEMRMPPRQDATWRGFDPVAVRHQRPTRLRSRRPG
jgi:hypothetical protein